jgi:dipeptidase
MVVALPAATGNAQTLFAANAHRPVTEPQTVRLVPGRTLSAGEVVQTCFVTVPQVRQTCTVLAVQPQGAWGYLVGVNEHRVAVACADWQSRIRRDRPGLLGPDLVRLTLERAHNANHALDVLTDLIVRHGQGHFAGSPEGDAGDHVFLLADPCEAFAVEAAGLAWAAQEIRQVRAASDVAVIRQDWYRLAPGLADCALAEDWWPADGSKLDFIGALSEAPTGKASALRRWGRATLLLEEQNGHLDAASLRRLCGDHYDRTHFEVNPLAATAKVTPLCQHAGPGGTVATTVSAVAELPADPAASVIFWVAFGPPCLGPYFPLLLDGDLRMLLTGEPVDWWTLTQQLTGYLGNDPRRWLKTRETFGDLQTRFEQDVEEFTADAAVHKLHGEWPELRRLAGSLMQSHLERFEETVQTLLGTPRRRVEMAAALSGMADF